MRRHEILRTIFPSEGGKGSPKILDRLFPDLKSVDLRALPHPAQEAALHHLAVEESKKPFDLAHGPLVRACLFALTDRHHVFLALAGEICIGGDDLARSCLNRSVRCQMRHSKEGSCMMTKTNEIADGIFRFSTCVPEDPGSDARLIV